MREVLTHASIVHHEAGTGLVVLQLQLVVREEVDQGHRQRCQRFLCRSLVERAERDLARRGGGHSSAQMRVLIPERQTHDVAVGERKHDQVLSRVARERRNDVRRLVVHQLVDAVQLAQSHGLSRSISSAHSPAAVLRPDGQIRALVASDNRKQQRLGGVEAQRDDVVSVGTGVQTAAPRTQRARVHDDAAVVAAHGEDLHLGMPANAIDVVHLALHAVQTIFTRLQSTTHIQNLLQRHFGYALRSGPDHYGSPLPPVHLPEHRRIRVYRSGTAEPDCRSFPRLACSHDRSKRQQ